MFAAALLALASTAVAAPLAPRDATPTPSTYAVGYLENYEAYHLRYLALECYKFKNTTFFDDCCHPLLATENLQDNRKPYCTPNATEVSSAAEFLSTYTPGASATGSADVAAQSEYCEAESSSYAYSAAATSAAATSDVASAQAQVAPAPTSTSSEAPAAAQTSEASSNDNAPSGQVMTGGYATFFYQGGNAGACGTVHSDSDKIIAIDAAGWWPDYASNSNSQYCGRWINIQNTQNGKTVTAMVADVCPTCVSDNSLDLSVGAFTAIADEWEGSVPITWSWA